MPGYRHLLLLALAVSLPSHAQVYKWVDANGQTHFGSQPPTPEQPLEEVELRSGYQGTPVPEPTFSAPDAGGESRGSESASEETPPSARTMCGEAVRWTAIDIPNLKEIGQQRQKDGKITREQYRQTEKALNQVKSSITVSDCMASKGKDRERYECLSRGAGIMVCSGAMEAAFKEAFKGI